jgi:hypothetical protein
MSQDDQRNQPDEDPVAAREAGAGPGSPEMETEAEAETAATSGGAHEAPATGDTVAAEGSGAHIATEAETGAAGATAGRARRRKFREQPGEGAPRYAVVPERVPPSGSEDSWSAQPHPGYQPDPARRVSSRRLLVSSVIGVVVLGGGSYLGYLALTAKSSNGNGPAAWTGAVRQNGAVVGGINAQNNDVAAPVDLPSGVSYGNSGTAEGAAINQAVTSCRTASSTSVPVTTATGTPAQISAWGNKATPTANDLHSAAATLQRTLFGTDAVTVANAAYSLCLDYSAVATVPPMPDAVGSQAWSAAVKAYATAASQALQGVSGKPAMLTAANDSINTGNAQLAALSARVNSAT